MSAQPAHRPVRPAIARGRDDAVLLIVTLSVASVAWIVVWAVHDPSAATVAPHHDAVEHGGHHHATSATTGIWLLGWAVMVIAMMLPPALPMLRVVQSLGRARGSRASAVAAAASFLGVWVVVGIGLWGVGTLLGQGVWRVPTLAEHPQWVAAAAIAAAGLFQFTPAKRACLTACRSPRAMAMTLWRSDRSAAGNAAALGTSYAMVCVGCCWALMVLTVAVGSLVMPVMVGVALAMAAERLLPRVRPLVPIIGLGALGLAGLVALSVISPGLTGG